MVPSRGMLVKSESISKLPMKLLESYSTISVANLNKSLTVYLLVVNDSKIGTKYFLSLYVGVSKADKIGLKGGQPSTCFLCSLQDPCIISGLVPTGFRCLRVFGHAVRVKKLFINFINVLFLTGNDIQEVVIFFLKFGLITSKVLYLFNIRVSVNYKYRIAFVRVLSEDLFVLRYSIKFSF